MIEQLKKEFQKLKKDIDELKIRTISDERERQTLQTQIGQIKQKVKSQFGVEIQFFEQQISNIQKQLIQKKQNLKKKIFQAKEKIR